MVITRLEDGISVTPDIETHSVDDVRGYSQTVWHSV